jgi:exopolyphosphatase/guanosine-5'-triphosphate,3'-diphosphate pyrophosphatase
MNLQVISGEQEAIYGYIGATHHLQITEGIMVDIGGGSTELVLFKNSGIQKALSIPVGSLNMYSKFVKTLIPGKSEIKAIADAVKAELKKVDSWVEEYELICGVGGTIRAACKLNNEIYGMPSSNRTLDAGHIGEIIKTIRGNDKESLSYILKTVPERIHTIIPGMTILQTIADCFNCKTINVSNYGIREGYLFKKFISEGIIHD